MAGGSSGAGETIDTKFPYYLHPSDYPKQLHVNKSLTDCKYKDWSQEMTNFLFAKNKIGFVDGTLCKPEKTDDKFMPWMRCDAMIKGWLTTVMEKEIRASVKYASTAMKIWNDLLERFGNESAPRTYELKLSIAVTRQENASVSSYYTKLCGLWDEIDSVLPIPRCECGNCKCGVGKKVTELKEKERLYEFLMGLNADFSVMRTQILTMKPTPSLGEANHLVAEDEQQTNISTGKGAASSIESAAFQVARSADRGMQSQRKNWSKTEKADAATKPGHCTHCGRDGHVREGCFKLVGYPDWWPGKGKWEAANPRVAMVEAPNNKFRG